MENVKNIAYKKYRGKIIYNALSKKIVEYNRSVKRSYILQYNSGILIDIGSGKGADFDYWIEAKLKFVIGIEPSYDSMKKAVYRYKTNKNKIKLIYLNGVGDKSWKTGDAALQKDKDSKEKFIKTLERMVDCINMCFTIHYMMTSKQSFLTLFENINTHLKIGGNLMILIMDGKKIHKHLQKNNGEYKIKHNDTLIFRCRAKYDYKLNKVKIFGTIISIYFLSVTGLQNDIDENLVIPKYLIRFFENNNYKLLNNSPFAEIFPEKFNSLEEYEKNVVDLYRGLIFKKIS